MDNTLISIIIYANFKRYPPTINTANILSEKGAKIDLWGIHFPGDPAEIRIHNSINQFILYTSKPKIKGAILYLTSIVKLLTHYLFKPKPSLIISYDAFSVLPSFIISRFYNVKWFYHQHDYWEKPQGVWLSFLHSMEKKLTKYAYVVSFPQEYRAMQFKEDAKLPKTPLIVHNSPRINWTDQYNLNHIPALIEKIQSNAKYFIIYQGGLSKYFNIERTIDALKYCYNEVGLLILGEEREIGIKKKLMKNVEENGLNDLVLFSDRTLPYNDLYKFTKNANLGLSILINETDIAPFNNRFLTGASNKIGEYASLGIPVILEDTTINQEFIKNYPVGFLVNSKDPQQYATKIIEILSDPKQYNTLSLESKDCFVNYLNYDKQFDKVISLINKIK